MIKALADFLTYKILRISQGSYFGESVNFFFYDTVKIFLLLFIIIFIISFIRTFFPPEKTRRILSHENKIIGNFIAALLGIATPFCSCSAVPLFLGFVEAGVPLGMTFSFLVASPMINEVAMVLLWGMFGYKIALIYIGSGLVIAVFSGIIIEKLKVEKLLEDFVLNKKNSSMQGLPQPYFKDRLVIARKCTLDIVRKIWLFVLIGIGIGAWIHGYVPSDFLARYTGKENLFAVPVAALIGIPLYSNAAGIIPLISVLTEKGVGIGTALAFMMAVSALSMPEFLILKKVMKLRLILIFAGIVGTGIIFTGYLLNFIIR